MMENMQELSADECSSTTGGTDVQDTIQEILDSILFPTFPPFRSGPLL